MIGIPWNPVCVPGAGGSGASSELTILPSGHSASAHAQTTTRSPGDPPRIRIVKKIDVPEPEYPPRLESEPEAKMSVESKSVPGASVWYREQLYGKDGCMRERTGYSTAQDRGGTALGLVRTPHPLPGSSIAFVSTDARRSMSYVCTGGYAGSERIANISAGGSSRAYASPRSSSIAEGSTGRRVATAKHDSVATA
eukprot:199531-Rhodomonas_salina.2